MYSKKAYPFEFPVTESFTKLNDFNWPKVNKRAFSCSSTNIDGMPNATSQTSLHPNLNAFLPPINSLFAESGTLVEIMPGMVAWTVANVRGSELFKRTGLILRDPGGR